MTARERLPNRRQCESFKFCHAGHPSHAALIARVKKDDGRAKSALIAVAGLMRKNGGPDETH
jgi:hypothetical protein